MARKLVIISGGNVSSFNGRSGAVVPLYGDYSDLLVTLPVQALGPVAGTVVIDANVARTFTMTLTGNVTLDIINLQPAGLKTDLTLIIQGNGVATVTYPGFVTFLVANPPTPPAGALQVVELVSVDHVTMIGWQEGGSTAGGGVEHVSIVPPSGGAMRQFVCDWRQGPIFSLDTSAAGTGSLSVSMTNWPTAGVGANAELWILGGAPTPVISFAGIATTVKWPGGTPITAVPATGHLMRIDFQSLDGGVTAVGNPVYTDAS